MPNAIIAVGRNIIIGSVHLHRRHPKEVEDAVIVDGTEVDTGDKEEEMRWGIVGSPRNVSACYFGHVGTRSGCTRTTIGANRTLSALSQSSRNEGWKLVEPSRG